MSVSVHADAKFVTVTHANGADTRIPLAALRHRCGCPTCAHPGGQRLIDPSALPSTLAIAAADVSRAGVTVTWSPDGHVSTYTAEDLDPARVTSVPSHAAPPRSTWDAASMPAPVRARYDDVAQDRDVLADWLEAVERWGTAVLTDVPPNDGAVAAVAEMFGHVRSTNYGTWFDVRSVIDPTNLADTSLGLGAHTDNPYRDPVPTLQLLHCLSSSATGGESFLVDGFRVADELRRCDPASFAVLTTTAVTFRYGDATAELEARSPLIELDHAGQVRAVRFNSRSMVPPAMEPDALAAWYDAFLRFAGLLADERFQVRFRLDPGELFIVDNRRVLHGRTAFEPTSGTRHLQGCYADIDGLRSTLAVLRRGAAQPPAAHAAIDEVFELFRAEGSRSYLGEPVSMAEHMLQTAHAAELDGAEPFLIVAALLHDIGHFHHGMAADSADHGVDTMHEDAGATWLASRFVAEVADVVRLHVAAKRYLCAAEPAYLDVLSPASQHSLRLQGGPFSPEQAETFARHPRAADAVRVRRWDDVGKIAGQRTPGLEHYRPLLEAALRPHPPLPPTVPHA